MRDHLIGWTVTVFFLIALVMMTSCGDLGEPGGPPPLAVGTAHVYTNKTGGSVIYCPEELDPVPTEWTYNGTAEISEDEILEQCELN